MNTSKRAQRRIAAAEEVCRAVRKEISSSSDNWNNVLPYLFVWMRHSGKRCYDAPKPLRKMKESIR